MTAELLLAGLALASAFAAARASSETDDKKKARWRKIGLIVATLVFAASITRSIVREVAQRREAAERQSVANAAAAKLTPQLEAVLRSVLDLHFISRDPAEAFRPAPPASWSQVLKDLADPGRIERLQSTDARTPSGGKPFYERFTTGLTSGLRGLGEAATPYVSYLEPALLVDIFELTGSRFVESFRNRATNFKSFEAEAARLSETAQSKRKQADAFSAEAPQHRQLTAEAEDVEQQAVRLREPTKYVVLPTGGEANEGVAAREAFLSFIAALVRMESRLQPRFPTIRTGS